MVQTEYGKGRIGCCSCKYNIKKWHCHLANAYKINYPDCFDNDHKYWEWNGEK